MTPTKWRPPRTGDKLLRVSSATGQSARRNCQPQNGIGQTEITLLTSWPVSWPNQRRSEMEYAKQHVNIAGAAERSIAVDMQYGSALGGPEVEQRGDLQYITDRINECIDRASSNAERVSILADRIKGTTPEKALDSAKLASSGNGAIADIHSRIDILMNALGATGNAISRLERL